MNNWSLVKHFAIELVGGFMDVIELFNKVTFNNDANVNSTTKDDIYCR